MYKVTGVILLFVLSASTSASAMQAKEVLDQLGHKELNSYFAADFDQNPSPTLRAMMYSGESPNDWIQSAAEVGLFLAKFRHVGARKNVKESAGFNATSQLRSWLISLGNSSEAYLNLLPQRLRGPYSDDVDSIKQRAIEALNLLGSQEFVCLQNVITENVKVPSSQLRLNANNVQAIFGPDSLDAAIFLADILLMYYKQMLEHSVQYKTVETAQAFGQALDEELGRQDAETEEGKQRFWSRVSLLTGWEIIRRCVMKDKIDEVLASRDPAAVAEAGLRLINNKHINNPNFMVMVSLALLR